MGQVFKKTTTRPVPSGAKIVEVGGKLTARCGGRGTKAKWMTAPVVTLDDGRQVIRQESSTYFARYRDHDKALIVVSTGCRDEEAAKQVLADLKKRVERIKAKVATVQELAIADRRQSPIGEHVEEYVSRLPGKKTAAASPVHRENVRRYLNKLVQDCGWICLADIRREHLEAWMVNQQRAKRSARSCNTHRESAVAFCNWLVEVGRLQSNPFGVGRNAVPKANEQADSRRRRRALTPDELTRLIEAARNAPRRRQAKPGERDARFIREKAERLSGPARADLYAFLAGTGLRVGEVRQLKVADLDLDAAVPVVRLSAAVTKNGKDDYVPLRSDLIVMLRRQVEGRKPTDPTFDIPTNLIERFHADCRRAGISYRDDRGLVVDVHSLRTTSGTWLSRSGVPPRVAQQLMRHSDIRLTMGVYTDPRLFDLQGAVESIPSVTPAEGHRCSFVAPSVAHDPVKSSATESFPVISSRDVDVA
jgi:integrase